EINQYFIESNQDGVPISREQRSVVYQRAKNERDTIPFGTQKNVYENGYEWLAHSITPKKINPLDLRVTIGGAKCQKPYSASILNISAMSFGSLSPTAIEALNGGAKDGNFAHNTGEGGISPYHLSAGADVIWQLGTGYFGCRTADGNFNPESFKEKSNYECVKMIEIKISQGAKPGHGGLLPAAKVTEEIALIREVEIGKEVVSPPAHKAFTTPVELLRFIQKLQELSGGKPVGFKLAIGNRHEFVAICKAMLATGIKPDFITVDGGEGGTGAAPLEFSNRIGEPGVEALIFVHNMLKGFGLRKEIKIITTGKITDAFEMIKRLALGADLFYSARGMMLALGCIQALRCNSNFCPAGVATQDPNLYDGLVVADKRKRVKNFHKNTVASLAEMMGAMGIEAPCELRPWHIKRRINLTQVKDYYQLYQFVQDGQLLDKDNIPEDYLRDYLLSDPNTFAAKEEFWTKL
ncbi:MAG: FMN-binding glutamate synthase family protein, partial [Candidatus Caenarcaniphilales bacterium]|nr:FMN-binding glutamate synthase family protein [Candidatus Caenarcaniphilales bacterium]